MKKLLIIMFVLVSCFVAAAATLSQPDEEVKSLPVVEKTVDSPKANAVASWD